MTREAGNNLENDQQNSESQQEQVTPTSSCNIAPATIVVETSKGTNSSTILVLLKKLPFKKIFEQHEIPHLLLQKKNIKELRKIT